MVNRRSADSVPRSNSDADPDADKDSNSDADPIRDADSNSDADLDPDPDADKDTKSDADPICDADSNPTADGDQPWWSEVPRRRHGAGFVGGQHADGPVDVGSARRCIADRHDRQCARRTDDRQRLHVVPDPDDPGHRLVDSE